MCKFVYTFASSIEESGMERRKEERKKGKKKKWLNFDRKLRVDIEHYALY